MRVSVPDLHRLSHSRASLWLIVVGLVALSGSAMVLSVGILLLVLAAVVMPMFALTIYAAMRSTVPALTVAWDHERVVSTVPRRSPESTGHDLSRWENEGGPP